MQTHLPKAAPARQFLKIEWNSQSNDVLCLPVDDCPEGMRVVDASDMVEELWGHYSTHVVKRFESTFPRDLLAATGLSEEVIKDNLLTEIYRPFAFPAILAERLAAQAADALPSSGRNHSLSYISLPALAGAAERIAPLLERELRGRLFSPASQGNHFARMSLKMRITSWAGFVLGIGIVTLNILRFTLSRRWPGLPRNYVLPENLFVLFNGQGNHTRHVWHWIEQNNGNISDAALLVLGHNPLEPELMAAAAARGIRVFCLGRASDVPSAILSLFRHWTTLCGLQARAENDLGIEPGLRFSVSSAGWWLRGFLHLACLRDVQLRNAPDTLAVFGLIAHAGSRMADLGLRERGAKTIHWLHGIVEDSLHYRAASSICLCQNAPDADLCSRFGEYGECMSAEQAPELFVVPPARVLPPTAGVLLVTNLIHPDNRFAQAGAPQVLERLLVLVAEYFRTKDEGKLTWRPHPRESETPEFAEFEALAVSLGYEVDNLASLGQQIGSHGRIITTFSGSIGDAAEAGHVPAIYAGLPYELEGHWGRLPKELKFRTAAELQMVLDRIDDPVRSHEWRLALCRQYNRPIPRAADVHLLLEQVRQSPICQPQSTGLAFAGN